MLQHETRNGHAVLILENELLKIVILPRKGADVCELVDKRAGVNFLLKTPKGLVPPGEAEPADFLDNYEGGWQELFPNTDTACDYKGKRLPFHGEVALLPWKFLVERDDAEETSVRFAVRCRQSPFQLQRLMRLRAGKAELEIEEVVINHCEDPAEFVWGHHLVLGGDFLEEGCRLEMPAKVLTTRDELYEPATARLAPGQREPWPYARGRREGEWIDLGRVRGPEVHSHDEIFITELSRGEIAVTNPRLRLRFALEWDESVFPWVVLWQPFGGSDEPPLTGIYGLGIEPWVWPDNLEAASNHGKAIKVSAGESFSTKLLVSVRAL
jgi:hypothetical protein